jgi:hypothetical protein
MLSIVPFYLRVLRADALSFTGCAKRRGGDAAPDPPRVTRTPMS